MTEGLPIFRYRGPLSGFGEAYGDFCRPWLADFCVELLENFQAKTGRYGRSEAVRAFVAANWNRARQDAPDVGHVIDGIARGSRCPVADVEFVCSFMDLVSLRSNTVDRGVLGCTTLSGLLPDGPVLAQNYDMERFYAQYAVAVQADLTDRPGFKAFTFAGIPACAGVSSAGYAMGINFLHCDDIAPGAIPHSCTVLSALTAGSIGEAVGSVIFGERACGHHYLFVDISGVALSLEVTAREMAHRDVTGRWFAHTNHYLASGLERHDELLYAPDTKSAPARRGSSLVRRARARQLLAASGPTCVDDLLLLLSDTCNSPMAICSASDDLRDRWAATTIASLVLRPTHGELRIEQRSPRIQSTRLR